MIFLCLEISSEKTVIITIDIQRVIDITVKARYRVSFNRIPLKFRKEYFKKNHLLNGLDLC